MKRRIRPNPIGYPTSQALLREIATFPRVQAALLRDLVDLDREYRRIGSPVSRRWPMLLEGMRRDGDVATTELEAYLAEMRAGLPARAREVAAEKRKQAREDAWESQAYAVPVPIPKSGLRRLQNRLVWMYHGTTTKKLPEILRRGLVPDAPDRAWHNTTPGWVYLCADVSCTEKYARKAVATFGGDPVVLRVMLPWNNLAPDLDDRDLSTFREQRRTKYPIRREQIFDLWRGDRNRHLRGPVRKDEVWRMYVLTKAEDDAARLASRKRRAAGRPERRQEAIR
jgi:hypothetical protein